MNVHDEIQVCTDCIHFLANGEGPADLVEHVGKMLRHLSDELLQHTVAGDDRKDRGFSWSPCEGCGSKLGGDRHHAIILCVHEGCKSEPKKERSCEANS